jgi:hypothetical protein
MRLLPEKCFRHKTLFVQSYGAPVTMRWKRRLKEKLRNVYWIGGGSAAGKSTIARRLAAAHGFHVYASDDVMADHARRSSRDDSPLLHRFMAMDMDERWVRVVGPRSLAPGASPPCLSVECPGDHTRYVARR